MHPSANDGQPAPAATDGGRAQNERDAGPAPSRWRRRPGLTALVVVGVVVAAAVAVVWFGVARDGTAEPAIGAGVKPPACAEPGTGDLVEPEQGSAFRFKMPECFRSGDALVSFAADRSDGTTSVVLVPVDVPLTPGESVASLIRVSAVDVGRSAVTATSQEVEEMIRRAFGISDDANVTMVRRTLDGARGWGYHIDNPDRPLVAWLFLKGTTQLSVVCRWFGEDLEARMLAGCNQIIDTLSIA
jgi:hypothetical protein